MNRKLISIFIAMACFSYPLTTVIFLKANLPTGELNFFIKAFMAIVYLTVLISSLKKTFVFNKAYLPLSCFFIIYGIRLLIDVLIRDIHMSGYSSSYVLSYFFLLTFLPVITLFFSSRFIDAESIHNWTMRFLILSNLALFIYALLDNHFDITVFFSGRIQSTDEISGYSVLNPITFGLMGASLSVFCLGKLSFEKNDYLSQAILIFYTMIGMSNMLLGASRGPFFGFAISLTVLATLLFRRQRQVAPNRMKTLLYLVLTVLVLALIATSENISSFLFDRLSSFFEDRASGAKEERDYQFYTAWQDFLNEPLLGSSFVTSSDNFYPHNIPLEVFMATGLVGGVLFILAVICLLFAIRRIFQGRSGMFAIPLGLVGICFLFSGLTSGSIHSSPEFWVFFSLLTIIGHVKKSGVPKFGVGK